MNNTFDHLLSPLTIRGLTLKNRIVLPGIGTKMSQDRHMSDQLLAFHRERANGGCGLNVFEVASVHAPSAPQGFLGIHNDACISGLAQAVAAVHQAGGKASIQLWQGGVNVMWDEAAEILVPSDFALSEKLIVPGMSLEKIEEVIAAYGAAAKRAVQAGFDTVEFHAAHNYLPHTFLSPAFNKREDEYGGLLENRMKFALEVIDAIRSELPESMPLFMRIDAHDDYLEEGLTIEETIEFCKKAKAHGVDVVNVSRGNTVSDALQFEVPPLDLPRGINVSNAERIKNETDLLVMVAGRINSPEYAERLVARGACDLVGIARGQIADPWFAKKTQDGNACKIVHCIACNQGCYDAFTDFSKDHITCMRNPAVGREAELEIQPAEHPEKILVAGGGVAGMEAALVLSERGHEVVLAEKSDHLGGRFATAGYAPRKEEMRLCVQEMARAVEESAVDVRFETDAIALCREEEFDQFICAIGAQPFVPPIENIDADWVCFAEEVLTGEALISGKVVVIGGGLVGLEAAEYCANRGCEVTVVEMADSVGNGLGDLRRICVKQALEKEHIAPRTNATVLAVANEGVEVQTESGKEMLPADYVVLAAGYSSHHIEELLGALGDRIKVSCIGDAVAPRRALDAIREGFDLAISL